MDHSEVCRCLESAPFSELGAMQLDGWIELLMQCKALSEADVKRLCDKVNSQPSLKASI